jgi:acyl carrier protein
VVAKRCEGVWDASPPIGVPMDNHRAHVLDGEMEPQGVGVPGELAIAGAGVGRGYLAQPAQTAERFRPDPLGPPGSRLYLTGDLARWLPDGDLLFLGRVDRQVKVRGVRIELGEIESALVEHEEVGQAVVQTVAVPRGNAILTAYVVGAGGSEPQAEALRAHLARKLPPPMVPTLFLALERIPLTASGKVDVRALPAVDFSQLAGSGDDSDLRSPSERKVAEEVFAPLLGVQRVGLHDHFFAIGGTSLQAFKIVPRIQEVFGVKLPLADFFQRPTVAEVAATVDQLRAEAAAGPDDDLLAALSAVEGRSDEEVEEMLGTPSGASGPEEPR